MMYNGNLGAGKSRNQLEYEEYLEKQRKTGGKYYVNKDTNLTPQDLRAAALIDSMAQLAGSIEKVLLQADAAKVAAEPPKPVSVTKQIRALQTALGTLPDGILSFYDLKKLKDSEQSQALKEATTAFWTAGK